jgi:MFS family permease
MMCKRFGPKIWLSFLSFGFGIVTTLTAVITTYEGLIIARIFLGALEAGIMPGISFTLSQL